MTTRIVTTFGEDGYRKYGKKMVESMERWLHPDIDFVIYYDGPNKLDTEFKTIDYRERLGDAHRSFVDYARIRQEGLVTDPVNSQPYEDEKQFLYDAARFSYKWFVMIDAEFETIYSSSAEDHDVDRLVWLDGDTEAIDVINDEFFDGLINEDEMISYLGRTEPYTETGFLLFNLNHENIFPFFSDMYEMYSHAKLFDLPQWIDCVVFDKVLEKYRSQCRNLTPNRRGHVWEASPLSRKLVHNKGLRKYD